MGIAFALFGSKIMAWGAAVVGWILGDWRRVATVILIAAFIATYIVADHRRAAADKIILQQRITALTQSFDTAAAAAKADEEKRIAQAGADAVAIFQHQAEVRDAQQAQTDAKTEQEIQKYETALAAAGRSCAIDPLDLLLLNSQPPAPKGRK